MRYLILGATGTLGRATVKALLSDDATESILCLSRDELKQFEMKKHFGDERLSFAIADIRDKEAIREYFTGIDTCFHFAALKRIPEMERHPMESLKTNVLGAVNAAECAHSAGIKNFIFSSTDKACLPINTYGACKFLAEQFMLHMQEKSDTNFSVYRWGNVVGSRGSAVHEFKKSLIESGTATLTDDRMSRFWIRIEDAVKFMLSTMNDETKEPKVPPMGAAPVWGLIQAIAANAGVEDFEAVKIGMRPGEKLHEDIVYLKDVCTTLSSANARQLSHAELRLMLGES